MTTLERPPAPPAGASLDGVGAYARAVVEGEIVTGRLVRLACERHLRDIEAVLSGERDDIRYVPTEALKPIEFFGLLEHTKGEWASRREARARALNLEPWQQFIIGSVFGWQRRDPDTGEWLRRFRIAYIEIARKNGKSTMAAGVANYLAFFDGEQGAEVYCAATKRDQAKIVFLEARRQMVKLRQKSERVRGRVSVLTNSLFSEPLNSKLEPLSADQDSMDGLNAHGDIVDELHAHKSRAIWDLLEESMAARRQPMHFAITTAGADRSDGSICWEQRNYAVQVLEGVISDDTYFAYIAAIDDDDDRRLREYFAERDDEAAAMMLNSIFRDGIPAKANPNLGISVRIDYLRTKLERARATPGAVNSTRQKHFDVWTTGESRWFDVERWRPLGRRVPPGILEWRCFGGLDLAGTTDLNCFGRLFVNAEPSDSQPLRYYWTPLFFMPRDNVARRVREDRVPYDVWARDGWITLTDGNRRDDAAILEAIRRERRTITRLEQLGADPWQMNYIASTLQQEAGTRENPFVVEIPQGFANLAAASEELEAVIEAGLLAHDGNPVMTWMMSNVVADDDGAGHRKPSKKKSQERIDGVSALVNALARAIVNVGRANIGSQIYV